MNTAPPEDFKAMDELAGEYVLGTLPYARRLEIEQRLATDIRLRAAVQSWQEQLLPLAQLAPPVEPSVQLWQRIVGSLQARAQQRAPQPDAVPAKPIAARAPRAHASNAGASGWWSSLQLWRGLAGTGFAAAAVMAAVLVTRSLSLPGGAVSTQYVVVLVAPGGNAPGWVVQASSPRQLSLSPIGQGAVPAGKALQFWTKGDTWTAPVSLGLVTPGEALKVPLDQLPPLQPNQLFELTLEPPGGSPTGRPTGQIQFIGRAVKVL